MSLSATNLSHTNARVERMNLIWPEQEKQAKYNKTPLFNWWFCVSIARYIPIFFYYCICIHIESTYKPYTVHNKHNHNERWRNWIYLNRTHMHGDLFLFLSLGLVRCLTRATDTSGTRVLLGKNSCNIWKAIWLWHISWHNHFPRSKFKSYSQFIYRCVCVCLCHTLCASISGCASLRYRIYHFYQLGILLIAIRSM